MSRLILFYVVLVAATIPRLVFGADDRGAEIKEHDEVWLRYDDLALEATVYSPEVGESHLLPVILDIHGGAWNFGDRTNGALYDRALAEAGFVVVAIDFRDGPEFKHPAAIEDVTKGVAWLRENRERLHIDTSRIGLMGSSSGGHLALLAGVQIPDVRYVIALWPVSDPYYRYRYAKRAGLERLVSAHDDYWVTESAMREASIARIVVAGEAKNLPPVVIIQPGEDSNVPIEMTFDVIKAWQAREGYIEYAHFPNQPHAFGHRPSQATTSMLMVITDFALRQVR